MKKIIVIVILFMCFFNVNAATIETDVKLKNCIDGDTAVFAVGDDEIKVRFLAINAPEVDSETYGKEASNYACKLLTDAKSIIIEHDSKATVDKYERTLAWIWVDDKLLQERLVSEGYAEVAYVYDKYKYADSLCLIQQDAIKYKKNIWSLEGREEDYCGGIDTSKVVNNIDVSKILDDDNKTNLTEKDLEKFQEQFEKIQSASNKITDVSNKVTGFLEDNSDSLTNVLLFVILGSAAIYLLLNTIKNLK